MSVRLAVTELIHHVATLAEVAAAAVIAVATLQAVIGAAMVFARRRPDRREAVRRELGRWLVLALELEIAADIVRTTVAPSWNEIGQLAAIVVLRTVLNYFLQRESGIPPQRECGSATCPPAEPEAHA